MLNPLIAICFISLFVRFRWYPPSAFSVFILRLLLCLQMDFSFLNDVPVTERAITWFWNTFPDTSSFLSRPYPSHPTLAFHKITIFLYRTIPIPQSNLLFIWYPAYKVFLEVRIHYPPQNIFIHLWLRLQWFPHLYTRFVNDIVRHFFPSFL